MTVQHHGSKPVAVRHSHHGLHCVSLVSSLSSLARASVSDPPRARLLPFYIWQPPFENNPIKSGFRFACSCLGYNKLWGTGQIYVVPVWYILSTSRMYDIDRLDGFTHYTTRMLRRGVLYSLYSV